MKKFLLAGIMVLGISSLALAHGWGMGHGNGYGYGHNGGWNSGMPCYNNNGQIDDRGYGYGMGNGRGYNQQAPEEVVKNADEAKAKVQAVIAQNYKGYKITDVEALQVPRGTAYRVSVNDASGNPFVFHVNPWGNVVGPMLNK